MHSTSELLAWALKKHPAKHWCDRYSLNKSALYNAKKRGHLSPALAGNFAIDLGLDVSYWMAIAATETERDSEMNERVKKLLHRKR